MGLMRGIRPNARAPSSGSFMVDPVQPEASAVKEYGNRSSVACMSRVSLLMSDA